MSYAAYAAWALAAGAFIPVMAILNGGLARAAGHPTIAAATLFCVAFTFCVVIALASGVRGVGGLRQAPPHMFLGGTIVGFYVLSITIIAPRFGVGNAILWVMVAQLFTSALIDHFGIMGAVVRPMTVQRAIGLAMLVAGLVTTQVAAMGSART